MTVHTVTLVFEDGRAVQIPADEAETVFLAALKAKVRIQHDCLEGECATCKAMCTTGEYWIDEHEDEALSKAEEANRFVLSCQMHVQSDCVIEYAYESSLAVSGEPRTEAGRVAAVEPVSAAVVRLVIEPGGEEPMPFLPGQYVHLTVPGTDQKRSFSFANPPEEADRLEFFIRILPEGAMSDYASGRAKAGDEVTITGPFGRFYLREPRRPILMVAGGTGLAPMLSMLDHMVANGGPGHPIRLLYGVNREDELFALDRLEVYPGKGLALDFEIALLEPGPNWDGGRGFVTDLLHPDLLAAGEGCDVYICGPPPMIEAARAWLTGQDVADSDIHVEEFLPS